MYEINPLWERIWKYGGRADLWIRNIAVVNEFITKNNLKPVPAGHLPMPIMASELPPSPTAKRTLPKPVPFPGGIRFAHLHYQGNIYVLTDDQWKEFAGRMLKDFQSKLATVKTINFEQAIELSAAIESLP